MWTYLKIQQNIIYNKMMLRKNLPGLFLQKVCLAPLEFPATICQVSQKSAWKPWSLHQWSSSWFYKWAEPLSHSSWLSIWMFREDWWELLIDCGLFSHRAEEWLQFQMLPLQIQFLLFLEHNSEVLSKQRFCLFHQERQWQTLHQYQSPGHS